MSTPLHKKIWALSDRIYILVTGVTDISTKERERAMQNSKIHWGIVRLAEKGEQVLRPWRSKPVYLGKLGTDEYIYMLEEDLDKVNYLLEELSCLRKQKKRIQTTLAYITQCENSPTEPIV